MHGNVPKEQVYTHSFYTNNWHLNILAKNIEILVLLVAIGVKRTNVLAIYTPVETGC